MRTHKVTVQCIFTAEVEVAAPTLAEAQSLVKENFSCVGPSYGDGTCESIISWDAPVHSEKKIMNTVDVVVSKEIGSDVTSFVLNQLGSVLSAAQQANFIFDVAHFSALVYAEFAENNDLQILSISISSDFQSGDDGSYYESFYAVVEGEISGETEYDNSDLEDQLNGDGILGSIYKIMPHDFVFCRSHFEPFFGQETVSGVAIAMHLASVIPEFQCGDITNIRI